MSEPTPDITAKFPADAAPTPGPDHICGPETCGADFALDAVMAGMDEDCADGLHEYCLTDDCICYCHVPELAAQGQEKATP